MKGQMISLFAILFFLATCAAQPFPHSVVRDTDGNPVEIGVEYYMRFVFRLLSGNGIALANTSGQSCPVSVVQSTSRNDDGLPITFHPKRAVSIFGDNVIQEFTPLYIKFGRVPNAVPGCSYENYVWTVLRNSTVDNRNAVTLREMSGDLEDWFSEFQLGHIESNAYLIIKYCVNDVLCRYIGRDFERDGRSLVLTDYDDNLGSWFQFVRAVPKSSSVPRSPK